MQWIVFIYKVPTTPTKYRAYIWRELKKMGALYLQDGVCILPDTDDIQLFIGALAEKAVSFGGMEFTFLSTVLSEEKNQEMIERFNQAREKEYLELIPLIEKIEKIFEEDPLTFCEEQSEEIRDRFRKAIKQFQSIETRDYFDTDMSKKIRLALDACRKKLNQFI